MSTAFFTICARNYLAFAGALGQSVLRHHPDATFTVWLLDQGEPPPVPEGLQLRPIDSIFDGEEMSALSVYYEILEFATAVKPRCFMAHFAEGARNVLYIDPDILLFRPLVEVFERLDGGAQGVLTPHLFAPLPADDKGPDDQEILTSGIYNLGFLALAAAPESDALLSWWWGWLKTHCFADKAHGVFTDQKWMDLAPIYWPRLSVLHDPTYNIAYWNLPQRTLTHSDGGWQVDGRPLTFFHFSGFNPNELRTLSKHQNRLEVKGGSALAAILKLYAETVLALGHEQVRLIKPRPTFFDNGIAVDSIARVAYRKALAAGVRFETMLGVGPGSLFEWLCRPDDEETQGGTGRPAITRYLHAAYGMRPDVRQAFPALFGADRERFIAWARRNITAEMKGDARMLERQLTPPAARVDLVGLPGSERGRSCASALAQAGVAVNYLEAGAGTAEHLRFDINIVEADAGVFAGVTERYCVVLWGGGELSPDWVDRLTGFEEVWVDDSRLASAMARLLPIPVLYLPIADGVAMAERLALVAERRARQPAPVPSASQAEPPAPRLSLARRGWRLFVRLVPEPLRPALARVAARVKGSR